MAERYLPAAVAELVEVAGRRPPAWAEERIRKDGRRFYAHTKQDRLRELLGGASDPDARRKLTNLASAEASRKKKQFIQERSFRALRSVCSAQQKLARAVAILIDANERQRKENVRIAELLAAYTNTSPSSHEITSTSPPPPPPPTTTNTSQAQQPQHPPPLLQMNAIAQAHVQAQAQAQAHSQVHGQVHSHGHVQVHSHSHSQVETQNQAHSTLSTVSTHDLDEVGRFAAELSTLDAERFLALE